MQLGFSSKIPLWVTSGRLYFDSLVDKHLSNLYNDSSANFQQSNDFQKVQFNTDLLSQRYGYLYRTKWRWLECMKSVKWLLKRNF